MEPVMVVELGKIPEGVRRARIARGLDPDTGRRPGAGPSPVLLIAQAIGLLAAAALFLWFVIAMVSTLLS